MALLEMSFSQSISSLKDSVTILYPSNSLTSSPLWMPKSKTTKRNDENGIKLKNPSMLVSCSSYKLICNPSLDKHVVRQNKIRFVQKLKTLLLSKPKHYMPLHILSKCRSYLSLSKPRSLLSMIHRYPSIFELFTIPTPATPLNATKSYSQLCVRLTTAAAALATQETNLKSAISSTLAFKLQKLLMLSNHNRLLLSKLVHVGPDLGLSPNFRSRLCNEHPEKFKIVDTSYGRALELVSWDPQLAIPLPSSKMSLDLIVERPLKFKHLRLQKGVNLKRRHRDFLIKFEELPFVCPYNTPTGELEKHSIAAEKRACGVIREILGMMVEKRTLVDHLTHFRKDFGLPNKLRGMLVRHPELFYVSLKGQRDSVFLVEGYDNKGALLEKDDFLVMKDRLMELVREGKRLRREKRKGFMEGSNNEGNHEEYGSDYAVDYDDYDDGFENLIGFEDFVVEGENEDGELQNLGEDGNFWTADSMVHGGDGFQLLEPW